MAKTLLPFVVYGDTHGFSATAKAFKYATVEQYNELISILDSNTIKQAVSRAVFTDPDLYLKLASGTDFYVETIITILEKGCYALNPEVWWDLLQEKAEVYDRIKKSRSHIVESATSRSLREGYDYWTTTVSSYKIPGFPS